jgi:hypothetical protein
VIVFVMRASPAVYGHRVSNEKSHGGQKRRTWTKVQGESVWEQRDGSATADGGK